MTSANFAQKNAARIASFLFLGRVVVAASLAIVCASCGSSSSSHTLSASQAQAVSQEFSTALQTALSASLPASVERGPHPTLGVIFKDAHPNQSSDGCVGNVNGETCNIPVSYTGNCPDGGTIAIAGAFDFTLNNSGDGSDNTTLTITPANCSVSNLTINGNPSITASTQISFANDAPVFPITLNETGGFTFGPNPNGSCTLNVQYTVSSETSCTVSGTICGQSVSGSC